MNIDGTSDPSSVMQIGWTSTGKTTVVSEMCTYEYIIDLSKNGLNDWNDKKDIHMEP